eukprot:CAMPEP_0174267932 /NCGR_PEP_ID=MMETSP0439-20130205/35443_1 /TAXON_ID=0 /ORGANISM="Stereomyxa ramosa, Strain Chinc5" /LENGTH=798 /DNA_ID=CAMNT_0015355751 /DNA_START=14 /DNA_END=2407 /DNA_ORIENTATION=-
MAEARNAVEVADHHKREGVHLLYTEEGIVLTLRIPHPDELLYRFKLKLKRLKRSFHNGVYPSNPTICLAITLAVIIICHLSGPDSWFRNGWLAWFLWNIGEICIEFIPFGDSFPVWFKVTYLAAWAAVIGFFILMALQRQVIRLFLSYKGWLYQEPNKPTATMVKIWGGILKGISGSNPLTYSFQSALPALPLPSVEMTCKRYLASMKCFLDEDKYSQVERQATAFLKGEAPKLQRYLIAKRLFYSNYVTNWWETYVYLRSRPSLMINSNYYIMDSATDVSHSHIQVARAAYIISHYLEFKQMLDNEELPPLTIRGLVPLCMKQYERLFSSTRIPGKEIDTIWHSDRARHIVVLRKGHFFKLKVYHHHTSDPLSAYELQAQLQKIVDIADELPDAGIAGLIPVLTTENRMTWADIREHYFSDGINNHSLHTIESGIFFLSLDDDEPKTWGDLGRIGIHGHGGCDRWFDKNFTLAVCSNGRFVVNGEHTWGDAPILAHLLEYGVTKMALRREQMEDSNGNMRKPEGYDDRMLDKLQKPMLLSWETEKPGLHEVIFTAKQHAQAEIDDLQLEIFCHDDYGKGFIKKVGVSPDAYVQMALQMAYFKETGKFTQTYEASMTRLYYAGRTETIRPVSHASVKFVKKMHEPNVSNKEKQQLLFEAAEHHGLLTKRAMSGEGVDRHLFALYVVASGLKVESEFLQNAMSIPWQLSTSQQPQMQIYENWLEIKKRGMGWENIRSPGGGFGPVADDGYGVSYMIVGEEVIYFHVSSKYSAPNTDSKVFIDNLTQSFKEMKEIFESEN